jgi:hypothetical protein
MSVHKPRPLKPRIGELLLSEGRISETTLARALKLQGEDGRGTRLGAVLLKWDLLAEKDLLEALSKFHRCPAADRDTLAASDPKVVAMLSAEQATRLGAIPYAFEDKAVRVAFVDPSNLAAVDEVKAITGRKVLPAVTSQVRLAQAHQRFYKRAVALDLWSVVQKLERRRSKRPVRVSEPWASVEPIAPSADPEQRVETARTDRADVRADLDSSSVGEPVEILEEPVEEFDTVSVAQAPARSAGREVARTQKPELDPFSDDCSLAKFVEDALTFFARDADLAMLAAVEEPVEELDPAWEEETEKKPSGKASSADSTMPRSKPRSEPDLSY